MAAVLAMILASLIAVVSYSFFPAQEETPPEVADHTLPLLDVRLSQYNETTKSNYFSMTKGETMKINVTLLSLSNDTAFTVPFYLSVEAFENEPLPAAIMITVPPSPYPDLPYSSYVVSSTAQKPFEANFDPNPLIIKPSENGTAILTITPLEAAEAGTYTIAVHTGNSEQTGLGGTTIQLEVTPS